MSDQRQTNKEIAEDAAYREQENRDAMAWGVGLAIGGMAMGDNYATRSLRMAAVCVAEVGESRTDRRIKGLSAEDRDALGRDTDAGTASPASHAPAALVHPEEPR